MSWASSEMTFLEWSAGGSEGKNGFGSQWFVGSRVSSVCLLVLLQLDSNWGQQGGWSLSLENTPIRWAVGMPEGLNFLN